MEDLHFEIKDSGNFIHIDVLGLEHTSAENEWDRRWLQTKISVKAGAFIGSYKASLINDDFVTLYKEFSKLYDNLHGEINFECLEDHLKIEIKSDGIGHFNTKVVSKDNCSNGAELTFYLYFDQTFLPEIIRSLERIIKNYPAI
jgi:hypothetical protein